MRSLEAAGSAVRDQGANPAPPVKPPTWEWYIPIYFWVGGISAGAWLAAAAEDLAGGRDREVIRTGRYIALGGLLAGAALLIADLGRPERFHYMLRLVRVRSAMSLGSWVLALLGPLVGTAAVLQAAEDGWLGRRPRLVRLSRNGAGRLLHATGLPAALFVGGYTGVLLASTSTPSWARRTTVLGPLFLASAAASGLAAVSAALEARGTGSRGALRRLRRAETLALAAELGLALRSRRDAALLPSGRDAPPAVRLLEALTLLGGIALPLGLTLRSALRRRRRAGPAGAVLALAGSLALRYLTTLDGYRSARRPDDTWRLTRGREGARALAP